MGLRVGLNLLKSVFGRNVQKTIKEVPKRMTRTMTDPSTGIVKMEREITYAGKEATATVEVFPNGVTKTSITGGGDNPIWRTKTITREKNASIFGGDKITVDKEYSKYWCHKTETKLTKEYNPQGVLEHKELEYSKNVGNEYFTNKKAIQDRVYNEYPLTSSADDMLRSPKENRYIKHSVDDKNNYGYFADGSSTNYTRAIEAKKQAAIDAAKKAEAEALAAKEAAKKAAAELKAKQPRINIAKALNKDINELISKETKLADGTIERTFSDPETGKILAKTQDKGILHKEWIYGGKADMIYMKQVGKDEPYIVSKKGNYTQMSYLKGNKQINSQVYYDGESGLKRHCTTEGPYNSAHGYVTVYDSTAAQARKKFPQIAECYPDYTKVRMWQGEAANNSNRLTSAQIQANKYIKELDKDAKQNFVNLDDLLSEYTA